MSNIVVVVMGNVTGGFGARARADAESTWRWITAESNHLSARVRLMTKQPNLGGVVQYSTMAIASTIIVLLQLLWAIQATGLVPIWTHPLANALVWTLFGGLAWLIMCSGRFARDVTGGALRAAEGVNATFTGSVASGERSNDEYRSTLLSNANPWDRRWIYAYDAYVTVIVLSGIAATWTWWHKYRSLGNVAHISNAYVLLDYRMMSVWLGGTLVFTVPLTAIMLMAFFRAYHGMNVTALVGVSHTRRGDAATVDLTGHINASVE